MRHRCLILLCLLACSGFAFAQADMPSQAQIDAMMKKQAADTGQLLDRAAREALPVGVLRAAPPPVPQATSPVAVRRDNLDDLLKQMQAPKAKSTGADVLVFISLSMPPKVIQELSRQAKDVGAVLVLRGLKDGSVRKTQEAASTLNPGGVEWLIHPEMFKQFSVTKVPMIVVADSSAVDVREDGCAPDAAFSAVAGDVSIEAALGVVARRGQPLTAQIAESKLSVLRGR